MVDAGFYLVTKEIALRSGMIDTRYRTQDGRFILNDRDLSRIRFSPNEYLTGLQGIERISASEANTLIAKNNNAMGVGDDVVEEPKIEEVQPMEETNTEEPVVEEEQVTDEPKVEETKESNAEEEAQEDPQEEPKKTTTKRK